MLRNILTVACTCGLMVAMSNQASAVITFNDPITIQTSLLDTIGGADFNGSGSYGDVRNVRQFGFTGKVAINGEDTPGTTPGFGVGDKNRLVGGVNFNQVTIEPGIGGGGTQTSALHNFASNAAFGGTAGTNMLEFTAVLQDFNGTVTSFVPTPGSQEIVVTYDASSALAGYTPVGGAIGSAMPAALATGSATGIIHLFVDDNAPLTPGAFATDTTMIQNAGTGYWVASFALTFGETKVFESGLISNTTELNLVLLDQVGAATVGDTSDDFFVGSNGEELTGTSLQLLSQLATTDSPVIDAPPVQGIDRAGDAFGGPYPVNIGEVTPTSQFSGGTNPFNPGTFTFNFDPSSDSAFPFDTVSSFIGNSAFQVVPEPSSMALLTLGLGALGAGRLRRRRKDEEEQA